MSQATPSSTKPAPLVQGYEVVIGFETHSLSFNLGTIRHDDPNVLIENRREVAPGDLTLVGAPRENGRAKEQE